MATRNRVIYQSQAVYAGPDKRISLNNPETKNWDHETGNHAPNQLKRVQSANYSFDIARQDVNQYGDLAAIDRVILEQPTVSLDFSWYLCSFHNEDKMGFKIDASSSCLTDILDNDADERNYYVRIVSEGSDAANFAEAQTVAGTDENLSRVIGVGNGFMASYTSEAAVGGFPTASVTVEALNMAFLQGTGGYSPHVDAANGKKNETYKFGLPMATSQTGAGIVNAIRPGDITLDLPFVEGAISDAKVQNYNLSFDLAREPLNKLGSRFAFAREITFPLTVTMTLDALVGDLTTGNLADIICSDVDHDITVHLNKADECPDSAAHIAFLLKKAKLDSQSFTSSIGDNESVTLTFSTQIGSSSQTDRGLFMSGAVT
tara:strand:+ start:834 stop:1958 length:1125 start_codon:yes stop_codon:yes gene_type:complete